MPFSPHSVTNKPLPSLYKPACKSALLMLAASGVLAGSLAVVTAASAQGAPASATGSPAAPAGDPVGNVERGHNKAATCLGCHSIPGYKADFPMVYQVPMIGGQNAKYIETALKEYRKGERRFPSMMATARSLSDQDIADVAAYFSSQR